MALSRGTGLKREGPYGTVPWKAWPLLCSVISHPLGVQSESDVGGDEIVWAFVTLLDRWAAVNTKQVIKTEKEPVTT